MKTDDLLVSNKRKRRIVNILSIVSLIGLVGGLISGLLYQIYEDPLYDMMAVCGLILFMLPFVFNGLGLLWRLSKKSR